MKHSVFFQNADNHWDNALPLGNGCFGAMLFFEENKLFMPLNHYEVYYNIKETVLPEDQEKALLPTKQPGARFGMYLEKAQRNEPQNDEPFCKYENKAWETFDPEPYSITEYSSSYPTTGELVFSVDDRLRDACHALTLFVEDAAVELKLENEDNCLGINTIVAREDYVVSKVTQTQSGLLRSIRISMEPYRDHDMPQVTYKQIDKNLFAYEVTRKLGTKQFVFAGVVRLIGAIGHLQSDATGVDIILEACSEEIYVLTGIYTDWKYSDPMGDGIAQIIRQDTKQLYNEHKDYWLRFFEKSSISIPDKFLEHIYYINQYALDCSSGKDGVMKHHACGLNGLWDVRHPNLWGSKWYWDVNIQAAFAGVFSSNRLDLAKVFSDGLRSYEKLAEQYARDVHNAPGVSMDYPHTTYYCIWPWCAQYLWQLYEYSLDENYLRNDAYPLFLKLCRFAVSKFRYDEITGTFTIYPDISPEQGPLTHDSTITIASVKYLLKFTLQAAEILGDNDPILEKCRQLLSKLPPYSISKPGNWGVHFNDSPDAPDNMAIRHPSMLMPLFPAGEFDPLFDTNEVSEMWSNTIDFLEDKCEIGIFGGSWIAAAAARLGRGQTALRLLYERGIDHMLRSNGLSAEETERFINDCLTPRQPLYYPCMVEFTGQMLAAVNEMLLQSHNGLIRIFPALPDGNREWERFHRHGWDVTEYIDRCTDYPAWTTLRFDRLLARGAFEISASMTDGKLDWILVHSQKGGRICITSPYWDDKLQVFSGGQVVPHTAEKGILTFDTCAGCSYLIAEQENAFESVSNEEYQLQVVYRESYTKRKVFLGENTEASYHKGVDGFLRDWYLGNCRMANHTLYKFDFTSCKDKVYTRGWTRQALVPDSRVIHPIGFKQIGLENAQFTVKQGYGFSSLNGLSVIAREMDDPLRRDFIQSAEPTEFWIEVPRGQYEMLVVSGDADEDSLTILQTDMWKVGGCLVKKGQYQCELIPVILKRDGLIRLKIFTKPGNRWKINNLYLNVIKGY